MPVLCLHFVSGDDKASRFGGCGLDEWRFRRQCRNRGPSMWPFIWQAHSSSWSNHTKPEGSGRTPTIITWMSFVLSSHMYGHTCSSVCTGTCTQAHTQSNTNTHRYSATFQTRDQLFWTIAGFPPCHIDSDHSHALNGHPLHNWKIFFRNVWFGSTPTTETKQNHNHLLCLSLFQYRRVKWTSMPSMKDCKKKH